jgi:hypothetical protein
MRTTSTLSLVSVLLLVAGCAAREGVAYKQQQNSGKMTRGSDVGYRAICTTQVTGSHDGIWTGPMYPDKERAMRDAVEHNKLYPGHQATVQHD